LLAVHGANGYLIDQFTQNTCNKRTDHYGGSVENRTRFALEVTDAVVAAVGPSKTAIRLSPYTDFQGMKMSPADITETFTHLTKELKARNLAYLHVVESRAASQASGKEEDNEEEKLDFVHDIWAPLPLLVAGGHTEDADAAAAKYENSLVVYGRYFISNPDLVARIKHKVAFRPYDRSTFYLPEQAEGYTTYPVEYGPEGKF
jgi:NADPH2 dehydrogenase